MSAFDLTFVLCAVLFNFLIIGVYISSRHERVKLRTLLGKIIIGLGIPLTIVFVSYILNGKPMRTLVYFVSILLYLIVELFLDFILKINFREKPVLHVPYIILFYFACLGFMAISFTIDTTWGYVVSVTFWGVLAALAYFLWGKKSAPRAS